jgi:hypothetical protein
MVLDNMLKADSCSGAADPATHKIYIWDISNDGQFVSALDGGREPLLHIHVMFLVPLPCHTSTEVCRVVASAEVVNRIHFKSRKHFDMAQPDSRKMGCVCRWVRGG